jgi:hypothetical protein
MLIVPVVSWILAYQIVEWGRTSAWQMPYQLMGYPMMPAWLWKVPYLPTVLFFLERQPHFYMTLLVALLFIVALSALLSAVYSVVYKLVGPPRLGPYDVSQPDMKVGRYRR